MLNFCLNKLTISLKTIAKYGLFALLSSAITSTAYAEFYIACPEAEAVWIYKSPRHYVKPKYKKVRVAQVKPVKPKHHYRAARTRVYAWQPALYYNCGCDCSGSCGHRVVYETYPADRYYRVQEIKYYEWSNRNDFTYSYMSRDERYNPDLTTGDDDVLHYPGMDNQY